MSSQVAEGETAAPADQDWAAGLLAGSLQRSRSRRVVSGVASGVAQHLGVEVLWVRVAFAALAGLGGAGMLAYGLLWVFARQEPEDANAAPLPARERQQALGLAAVGIGLFAAVTALSGFAGGWYVVPLVTGLGGAALVWREADEVQRRRWRDGARTGVSEVVGGVTRTMVVRVVAGVVLLCGGMTLFLVQNVTLDQLPGVLLAVAATLIGVAVITIPWWLRLIRELDEQRRASVRTREREEIAAHLHDSVLQTLALIQKQAENPREVVRLARGQERQLRSWLYGPSGYGGGDRPVTDPSDPAHGEAPSATMSAAVARACGEVEDTFAVAVQHVVVGDCQLDEPLTALVQAAREAIVNSAKHSGEGEVSVYVEVEPEEVTVFVRDRGKGFDPAQVSADRHGLADSIHGRMERNGGRVTLRTAPGEGAEVQLSMPRRKESRT
ncbi:signal transduction histidine kinase [Kutzneria viridogrisea]|uniref:Signal transduction histidine kinase n=1 Tax=Kutzneria viridogrisea TaxID=47990 RepID=A0ABR6BX95_9PSEU|nr:ATP-binding protein [Kutzneria albida]MBA8931460.1 signal transduction histidine kinase [Kutzneria viridogrisea]